VNLSNQLTWHAKHHLQVFCGISQNFVQHTVKNAVDNIPFRPPLKIPTLSAGMPHEST